MHLSRGHISYACIALHCQRKKKQAEASLNIFESFWTFCRTEIKENETKIRESCIKKYTDSYPMQLCFHLHVYTWNFTSGLHENTLQCHVFKTTQHEFKWSCRSKENSLPGSLKTWHRRWNFMKTRPERNTCIDVVILVIGCTLADNWSTLNQVIISIFCVFFAQSPIFNSKN